MSRGVWYALIVVLLMGCAIRAPCRPALCRFVDFQPAPYDHIIEDAGPFVVRELRGRFKVRPDDIVGGWPPSLDASMEIHGPNGFSERVGAADDGTFRRPGLPPGRYCFKVSASGFRSITGEIVIDPRGAKRPIEITLMISD